jgi:hypothetical protein
MIGTSSDCSVHEMIAKQCKTAEIDHFYTIKLIMAMKEAVKR